MQKIIKKITGVKAGDKIELGYIPIEVKLTAISGLVEYIAFPAGIEGYSGDTIKVAQDGSKSFVPDGILPFEGEFIPPENPGEVNTRLSKGIELGSPFGDTATDYILESLMAD